MLRHVVWPEWQFRDTEDTKVSDWLRSVQGRQKDDWDVALLGVPLSKTSITHSAAFRFPAAVRSVFRSMTPYSVYHALDLRMWLNVADLGDVVMHLTDMNVCHEHIQDAVQSYWEFYDAPLVLLGGDHSITACAVAGLTDVQQRKIGIVHFDAHHDVRNLADGGRHNGTPFRSILESTKVEGSNIVQIGLRDFVNAPSYHEYVVSKNVRVVTSREVHRRGLNIVLKEAWDELIRKGVEMVYVSFDLDVLDPSFAPGVPAPAPGGLSFLECAEALEWLGQQAQVVMLDMVCADPTRDVQDLTARVAASLILSFFLGISLRYREKSNML